MPTTSKLPSRLHHTAYTTKDMEKTRTFYEEVIGLPLVATWSESDKLFGKMRTYCHCFFGLADGGALAFFQFADKSDERKFSPSIAETPFHHIALKVPRSAHLLRRRAPQRTAFFTSATIFFSSAADMSLSAQEVGHIAPWSMFASSRNPNVA